MAEISIVDINRSAGKSPELLIKNAEERYHRFISDVAARVALNDEIRVILLAGPSGSGKTTTANMLSDAIKERGLMSFVVSLDDFYRDSTDPAYPRLEDGSRDFESPEALNIPNLIKTLSAVSNGNDFEIPHYDFKIGARSYVEKYEGISHGCVIIEGLHALNPQISNCMPSSKLLKMFISVSTNVNENGQRILSGRKLRFVRRMVRDSLYRNSDAERTLGMWANVLLGEDKYLYPHRGNADITFDTFHSFEIGVTKPFVLKLISKELAERDSYAAEVRAAAEKAVKISEKLVPENSLIREFIPGGIYEDLY